MRKHQRRWAAVAGATAMSLTGFGMVGGAPAAADDRGTALPWPVVEQRASTYSLDGFVIGELPPGLERYGINARSSTSQQGDRHSYIAWTQGPDAVYGKVAVIRSDDLSTLDELRERRYGHLDEAELERVEVNGKEAYLSEATGDLFRLEKEGVAVTAHLQPETWDVDELTAFAASVRAQHPGGVPPVEKPQQDSGADPAADAEPVSDEDADADADEATGADAEAAGEDPVEEDSADAGAQPEAPQQPQAPQQPAPPNSAEEPAAEEQAEEPAEEQAQEPAAEEPAAEVPAAEEPAADQPQEEQPTDRPAEDPAADAPAQGTEPESGTEEATGADGAEESPEAGNGAESEEAPESAAGSGDADASPGQGEEQAPEDSALALPEGTTASDVRQCLLEELTGASELSGEALKGVGDASRFATLWVDADNGERRQAIDDCIELFQSEYWELDGVAEVDGQNVSFSVGQDASWPTAPWTLPAERVSG